MTGPVPVLAFLFAIAGHPISDLYVRADPRTRTATVHADVEFSYGGSAEYSLEVTLRNAVGAVLAMERTNVRLRGGRAGVALPVEVRDARSWSPEQPVLYSAAVRLLDFRGLEVDRREVRFGFRTFERRANRLFWNQEPFFMRGFAGEFLSSGDHGCMTNDTAYIRRRITAAKAYGFNAERHHSHEPTETYLSIADELGLVQQVEIHGRMREGPGSPEFAATRRLWEDVVRLGRKHVSVAIYSMGNEVYANEPKLVAAMDELYDTAKRMNPDVLVLNRSGSLPGNDAVGKYDLIERPIGEYEHTGRLARAAFEAYLRGDRAGRAREFPVIAHEYPLASAYPRLDKAQLYPVEPPWFKAARENAARAGTVEEMPRFARNAEAIQWRVIKQMIEAARSFNELAGYSMLRLNDTASMVGGILDDFANPKSVPAETFLRVNGPVALIATWPRETFRAGETIRVPIAVSNHSGSTVIGKLEWWTGFSSGVEEVRIDGFGTHRALEVTLSVPAGSSAGRNTLGARLGEITNSWDFWVFPAPRPARERVLIYDAGARLGPVAKAFPSARIVQAAPRDNGVLVTDSWPAWMDSYVENGGRVLLISDKNWREPEEMGNHGTHLAWFTSRAPVALPELDEILTHWLTIPSNYERRWGNSGTVVVDHPAFGDFPHEGFCDFQFLSLIRRAKSFWLDRFPRRPRPLIRSIDNFWRGHNKAYLVEFGVGRGKVLATTLNFTQHLGRAPEADYLLSQFISYAGSTKFAPEIIFTAAELREARERYAAELPALLKRMGDANAPPDKYRYNPLSGDMN